MTDQQYTPIETTVRYWYIYARRASAEFNLEQVPDTSEAWAEFDRWLAERDARIEAAAEQRGEIKALRDVEASLINWDVLYGHEQGTAEDHESNRIAAWIGRRADRVEGDDE